MENIDKNYPLDEEEKEILEGMDIESSTNENNPAFVQYKQRLKEETTRISITIQKEDIESFKKLSKEVGIPYQTLISSTLHRYITGQIKLKKTF